MDAICGHHWGTTVVNGAAKSVWVVDTDASGVSEGEEGRSITGGADIERKGRSTRATRHAHVQVEGPRHQVAASDHGIVGKWARRGLSSTIRGRKGGAVGHARRAIVNAQTRTKRWDEGSVAPRSGLGGQGRQDGIVLVASESERGGRAHHSAAATSLDIHVRIGTTTRRRVGGKHMQACMWIAFKVHGGLAIGDGRTVATTNVVIEERPDIGLPSAARRRVVQVYCRGATLL